MTQVTERRPSSARARTGTDTVFILGPARSGTTLLYKGLCLHPDVAFISNWSARFPRLPLVAALNRAARRLPSRALRTWFGGGSNAYVYGTSRRLLDRAFPSPVEGEPVYTAAGVERPGGPAPARVDPRQALPAAFDSIRSLGSGSCLVSKRIANNLRIPLLHQVFPNARFIVLVRDGRAVADSLSRVDWWDSSFVWWYGGTPRAWQAEGKDPWEICARNWVEELTAIDEGLQAIPEELVMRLRYEDLVAEPTSHLQAVAGFVGLPDDAAWSRSILTLPITDKNDGWKARLEPSVVDRITAIQRRALERFGYEG
jgi:hypothetical protein